MVPVLLLALLTGLAGAPTPQADRVCVVANVSASVEELDLDLVRRIFLLRQRFWPDGAPAHPVNLPASSPIRERFSREAFGQSVKEMAPYWNERYFHGTRPPPTVASEAAVLLFVARTRGGVGYVREAEADALPDGVRILACLPGDQEGEAPPSSENTG